MNNDLLYILLVEDDETHIDLIREGFEIRNGQMYLTVVRTIQEAKTYLRDLLPHLIITDIQLPDGLGLELIPADSYASAYPIIVMTNQGDQDTAVAVMKAGAQDYIVKSEESLRAMPLIVERVLRGWSQTLERRFAEAALRESEANFRVMFDQSLDVIMIIDTDTGKILRVNQTVQSMLGYNNGDLIDRHYSVLFMESNDEVEINLLEQVSNQDAVITFQTLKRADGTSCPVDITATKVPWGKEQAILATFRDITERLKAERSLEQRAAQLTLINHISSQIASVLKFNLLLKRTVQLIQETFGYLHVALFMHEDAVLRLEAIEGSYAGAFPENHTQSLDQGIIGWVARHNRKVVANDISRDPRYMTNIPDKTVTKSELCLPICLAGQTMGVLDIQCMSLNTFSENTVLAMETLTDQIAIAMENARLYEAVQAELVDREQAESELRRRNSELELLNQVIAASPTNLESNAMLEMVCRELATVFSVSRVSASLTNEQKTKITIKAEYKLYGDQPPIHDLCFSTAELPELQYILRRNTPMTSPNAQLDPVFEPVHNWLKMHGVVSLFLLPLVIEGQAIGLIVFETLNERRFTMEEIRLAWSVARQVAGVLAQARLLEERRRLQEQYHQDQKMEALGRLAGGVAHDFNNLLTIIISYSDLIMSRLEDESLRDPIEEIYKAGERAASLTRQLLAFTRNTVIEPQVLGLNVYISELETLLQRVIGEDIILTTRLEDKLWPVKVDPAQIELVIVNMAINARDAMPTGGQLVIESANVVLTDQKVAQRFGMRAGEYIELSISDTGQGMDEETQSHIFEPFFTTKEAGKGSGLGLAIAFGIIQQFDGYIWPYSEENVGTTFKIYLPRASEEVIDIDDDHNESEAPLGNETILLVEDDPDVRGLVRLVLQGQGYTLLEAPDGLEAMDLVSDHPGQIDLLLTDVIMPGMSGKVLAEELLQVRPKIKTLFMSGYTDNAIEPHGILDPSFALLQKPFSPKYLARKVRTVLDN